jgi:trigger factor
LERLRQRFAQQGVPLASYLRASGQTEDDLRAELRDAAAQRLRTSLLLRAIAEKEGITVDEEVDRAVAILARSAEAAPQERAAAFARSEQLRDRLESDFYERKLVDRLIDIATEGRGAVTNGWVQPAAAENATADEAADNAEPAPLAAKADDEAGTEPAAANNEAT